MFTCGGYDMRPLKVLGCILYQYTCHSTTLFTVQYQCIGHWEYTLLVYWPLVVHCISVLATLKVSEI